MRYAIAPPNGERIEPIPHKLALCPICDGLVRSKCGRINAWHWAHVSQVECDPWAEPDSTWHRGWQGLFGDAAREVTIGRHRADIAIPGAILELQHSHLSVDEIHERETFYQQFGYFAWLFDATEAYDRDRINLRTKEGSGPQYRSFRWKQARKSIAAARATVYLDLGSSIIKLGAPLRLGGWGTSGWGWLRTRPEFLLEFATTAYRWSGARSK